MPQTVYHGTNNQITGGLYVYDAAGDTTQDVNQCLTYLYDPEGCVCAVRNTKNAGMSPMTGYISRGPH